MPFSSTNNADAMQQNKYEEATEMFNAAAWGSVNGVRVRLANAFGQGQCSPPIAFRQSRATSSLQKDPHKLEAGIPGRM